VLGNNDGQLVRTWKQTRKLQITQVLGKHTIHARVTI